MICFSIYYSFCVYHHKILVRTKLWTIETPIPYVKNEIDKLYIFTLNTSWFLKCIFLLFPSFKIVSPKLSPTSVRLRLDQDFGKRKEKRKRKKRDDSIVLNDLILYIKTKFSSKNNDIKYEQ